MNWLKSRNFFNSLSQRFSNYGTITGTWYGAYGYGKHWYWLTFHISWIKKKKFSSLLYITYFTELRSRINKNLFTEGMWISCAGFSLIKFHPTYVSVYANMPLSTIAFYFTKTLYFDNVHVIKMYWWYELVFEFYYKGIAMIAKYQFKPFCTRLF